MQTIKQLTPQQAHLTIKQYCAYQERCHSEVKDKLYKYGLTTNEVDDIISNLIEENYLNEERFAIQYAGGKFRIKQWGKVKIKYSLQQKRVSDYCIRKALATIDMVAYKKTMYKLADAKYQSLKAGKDAYTVKRKLHAHLLQKGFENDLIKTIVNDY